MAGGCQGSHCFAKDNGRMSQSKKALVLVSLDQVNVRSVLNGAGFGELQTFEEFKKECLSFWRLMGKEDKLLNICNFISTPCEGEEFVNLYTQVKNNWDQVRRDILNSPLIPTPANADGYSVV